MSFSEIQLPNLVISDFYKSSLVEIVANKQTAEKSDPAENRPQYLGQNRKYILVLVDYPHEEHLPAAQLDFLSTILKACQLDIADIAIINTAKLKSNLDDYLNALTPRTILLFGSQKLTLTGNEEITHFTITHFGEMRMVRSPVLDSLNQGSAESKLLKRNLWDCLKKLFNI